MQKDTLITAINEIHPLAVGIALTQLSKDLAAVNRPLVLDYAAVMAFENKIETLYEYGKSLPIAHREKECSAALALKEAFAKAFDNGVLVTQDMARGRIAG